MYGRLPAALPLCALPLTRMQQLATLDLDLSHISHHTTEELVGLVSLLSRQASALKTIKVSVAVGS